jgi:hypothetical protein
MTVQLSTQNRHWLLRAGLGAALLLVQGSALAIWTAVIAPDPVSRQQRCLLLSESQVTTDGYDSTPVRLMMDDASLWVVTESELDTSFADLRLQVDAEPMLRSDHLAGRQMILIFDQDIPALIQRFRTGRQVTVFLRFWPTWPATELFPVRFSLGGFSRAHDSMSRGCLPAR